MHMDLLYDPYLTWSSKETGLIIDDYKFSSYFPCKKLPSDWLCACVIHGFMHISSLMNYK